MLASNILAQIFYDNGAKLEAVTTSYPLKTPMGREVPSPNPATRKMSFQLKEIESLLGIRLSKEEAVRLLERMQYNAKVVGAKVSVEAPCYRSDIMHPVDVMEDIAIAYGYNRFEPLDMERFTAGALDSATVFTEKVRRVMAGLGFQELISPVLTSREASDKMGTKEEVIEIENPMTTTYSAVRSSILPCLLGCLSKNKNVEYPQKVFEAGECVLGIMAKDMTKVAACIADSRVSYEDIASVLDALLRSLGLEYKVKPANDPRFIEGRAGIISLGGDKLGIVGEVSPKVLNNWGLENPAVAFELNITKLMENRKA